MIGIYFIIFFTLYILFVMMLYIFIVKRLSHLSERQVYHTGVKGLAIGYKKLMRITFFIFLLMVLGTFFIFITLI